jgi:uncharacterized protein YbjT (DUF2867 family)
LLAAIGIPVRVLARDPATARPQLGPTIEIAGGDITKSETLDPAVRDVAHIIFTAGCRSGRPVRQSHIRATEFGGVVNTLGAAERAGLSGRFLYMTSTGVRTRSFWTLSLNVYKATRSYGGRAPRMRFVRAAVSPRA